jgi:ribosome biogenesis GTP-binding protein YsxC/EngB
MMNIKHSSLFIQGLYSAQEAETYKLEPVEGIKIPSYCIFAGRSNVGKSSLMNRILGTRASRVSRAPGRTEGILLFHYGTLCLADLPGYGYSTTPAYKRASLMESFFYRFRSYIVRVFLLIDSRHGLKPSDIIFLKFMKELGLSVESVLTKTDKTLRKDTVQTRTRLQNKLFTSEELLQFTHIWMISDYRPLTWQALEKHVKNII